MPTIEQLDSLWESQFTGVPYSLRSELKESLINKLKIRHIKLKKILERI